MRYPMQWFADEMGLFSLTLYGRRSENRYIVVEAMPDGGWDWVIWTGRSRRDIRFGAAHSLDAAKASATRAAGALWPVELDKIRAAV